MTSPAGSTANRPPSPTAVLALSTLCLAQLIESVDATIVNVALPAIGRDLSLPAHSLAWVVNAYVLLFGGLLLLGGRAGDLLGHKRMFIAGVALFTVASAASGAAPDSSALVVARAAQGAAAALVAPMTLALISVTFVDESQRRRAFSVWGVVTGISASIGVLAGGVLTSAAGWRWIFLINVPIGFAVVGLAVRCIPSSGARPSWRGLNTLSRSPEPERWSRWSRRRPRCRTTAGSLPAP